MHHSKITPRVVRVTRSNIEEQSEEILSKAKEAEFVAIDTEFAGTMEALVAETGEVIPRTMTATMKADDKYFFHRRTVSESTMLSIGLSFWTRREPDHYAVTTFDLLVHREAERLAVSTKALAFLCRNGFDLNQLFLDGIPYAHPILKRVFGFILSKEFPGSLVFHNGFLDVIYLWNAFIFDLPESLAAFGNGIAAHSNAVFDTKMIYRNKWECTNLEYLFRKAERENNETKTFIVEESAIESVDVHVQATEYDRTVCSSFANLGFCSAVETCKRKHDLDAVLDNEWLSRTPDAKKPKLPLDMQVALESTIIPQPEFRSDPPKKSDAHNSGYDAFSAGYIFAYSLKDKPSCKDTINIPRNEFGFQIRRN